MTNAETAVAAVIDMLIEQNPPQPAWVAAYAGATYRAVASAVPAHHTTAVGMAEAELGPDHVATIPAWVDANRTGIETAAASLDALRELAPPPPDRPAEALAAAAVAELLAHAAGDSLPDVLCAGAYAGMHWVQRFFGTDTARSITTLDPLVSAVVGRWMTQADRERVAYGVRRALSEIDALAGGDYHRDSDGSGLNRNDCVGRRDDPSGGLAGV